jgi:hypothetical protein
MADAYFGFWKIGLSDKVVAELREKWRQEMLKQMTPRGTKVTIDFITAYGTKPE